MTSQSHNTVPLNRVRRRKIVDAPRIGLTGFDPTDKYQSIREFRLKRVASRRLQVPVE